VDKRPADLQEYIRAYKTRSLQALNSISEDSVAQLVRLLTNARDTRRQVFVCGNGGSAATASHFANDLGKGASFGREKKFRVLSLTDNVPWISALANDLDYSDVFVEQLKNYAETGDIVIAFSGSGNSRNVIKVVEWANSNGLSTIGITGRPGGRLALLAQLPIFVESSHMGNIEEGHFLIQHLVGYYFMENSD
jgi:D-sedoheptulose 7-phosphate isomerase